MEPFIDTRGVFSLSDSSTEHIPGHIRRAISELNVELLDALHRSAHTGADLPLPEVCRPVLARLTHPHQRAVGNCGLVLVDVERSIGMPGVEANAALPESEHLITSWLKPEESQSLIQSVWMVSWYLCQWNERVARILLDLPADRTEHIARSAPRDWVQWSRGSSCRVIPRWQHNALMWRSLLSSTDRASINVHQRLVGRGLQLSAGSLVARRDASFGLCRMRKEP